MRKFHYTQHIAPELRAAIDLRRGGRSLQEFTTNALIAACEESTTVVELRAEIERLHATIRAFALPKPPIDVVTVIQTDDDRMGWE